jgi:hypothetical protein
VLERSEVRVVAIEMIQEGVRQRAVGWVDDVLRLGRPWPLRLYEIRADVSFHHGEDDSAAPRITRRSSPREYRKANCACIRARAISPSSIAAS